MKSSAKLHATVIYYLGEQEHGARQITGPKEGRTLGRQDQEGKRKTRRSLPVPSLLGTAAVPSRVCGGDLSQLALREPAAGLLRGLLITLIAQSIKRISPVPITKLLAFKPLQIKICFLLPC